MFITGVKNIRFMISGSLNVNAFLLNYLSLGVKSFLIDVIMLDTVEI